MQVVRPLPGDKVKIINAHELKWRFYDNGDVFIVEKDLFGKGSPAIKVDNIPLPVLDEEYVLLERR